MKALCKKFVFGKFDSDRKEALRFLTRIGPERIISVTERALDDSRWVAITVWYWVDDAKKQ